MANEKRRTEDELRTAHLHKTTAQQAMKTIRRFFAPAIQNTNMQDTDYKRFNDLLQENPQINPQDQLESIKKFFNSQAGENFAEKIFGKNHMDNFLRIFKKQDWNNVTCFNDLTHFSLENKPQAHAEKLLYEMQRLLVNCARQNRISSALQSQLDSLFKPTPPFQYHEQLQKIQNFFSGENGKLLAPVLFGNQANNFLTLIKNLNWLKGYDYLEDLAVLKNGSSKAYLTADPVNISDTQSEVVKLVLRLIKDQIKIFNIKIPDELKDMFESSNKSNETSPTDSEKFEGLQEMAYSEDIAAKFIFETVFDEKTGKDLRGILQGMSDSNAHFRLAELKAFSSHLAEQQANSFPILSAPQESVRPKQ